MPKYKNKPVVIEAVQYTHEMRAKDELPDGVVITFWYDSPQGQGDYPTIHAPEGPRIVENGDYIITGLHGDKSLCKADVFALVYEPIEPTSPSINEGWFSESPKLADIATDIIEMDGAMDHIAEVQLDIGDDRVNIEVIVTAVNGVRYGRPYVRDRSLPKWKMLVSRLFGIWGY